ncbi:MAG: serine/threonine-protein kinase PknK [Silvanigrellaceae bacterium]
MKERILDNTYRLLEEIGRGGFGAVFKAVRIGAEGSGPVAIKFLSRGNLPSLQEQIRFQREATLMSQLLHPGTVTVYELGEHEGQAYIVMEYVDGQNLREYVKKRGGRLPLADILEILIQSAEALEYVHGHNIVHRDIKPQNVLVAVAKEGSESKIQVKIVDFGVARLSDTGKQGSEQNRARAEIVGTFNYMAPESTGMVNWGIDARADIYSLGIVAYELVTGRTPFQEFKNNELLLAHIEKAPPPFSQFDGPRYHELLERIVLKCIEKRPDERYQSMFGLLSDLKRLMNDVRVHGMVVDAFEIATKDVALSRIFNKIFVGRGELVDQVVKNINFRNRRSRVTWGMIRSTVGLGRTRCLAEVRRQLDDQKVPYLHVRFTESEQRLSLRALSLAVNEQLQALEIRTPHVFQALMQDMARIAGSGATDVARLIPALRPHLMKSTQVSTNTTNDSILLREEGTHENDEKQEDLLSSASEMLEKQQNLKRKMPQVRAPIQQVFLELLAKIAEQTGYLVFLLDDVHLADPASIGLFQFITEKVNDQANFAFVMTIREGSSRQNFVLDNFLIRLSNLRRRFQVWDLEPLSQYDFQQFLQAVGLPRPTPKFVEFVTAKCEGSPLLLHALLKQMVESEALVAERRNFNPWEPVFRVDWSKLSQIVVDYRNVEALLASMDRLDKRDQRLTNIAAVSHEACEFEYFRIDQDFTSVELETRLLSLVRRGVFEILGDENLPVQRRSFVFSHEKLRTAVLSGMELQTRRQIHLALANRIILLYPKPRREHILSLAKHFEGAGTLADAERSSAIFLKAARLHARGFEHSLAKYYAERAMSRASSIGNQQERLIRLREAFETEYMIHIAQNELVAASDVCQQLVALTFEPQRKETLQLHWGQLLLGLGRHTMAYGQVVDAIDRKLTMPFSKFHQFITSAWQFLIDLGFFNFGYKLLQMQFLREQQPPDNQTQGLMLMTLAQAHGAESRSLGLVAAAMRLELHRRGPTRPLAVFNMMIAAHMLRAGRIDRAFEIAESLERAMESNGRVDIARWVRALRAVWLDYPMGRIERLARVLDERKDGQLPSLGVLNTESHALRSWIRSTSPRIWRRNRTEAQANHENKAKNWFEKGKHTSSGYVADRVNKARKLELMKDKQPQFAIQNGVSEVTNATKSMDESNPEQAAQAKQVRRLREAGENGQFVGLALFSDSLRYCLSDRLDPLRRAVDQFSRQRPGAIEGEIFKLFSIAIQDLAHGQYRESLDAYVNALRLITRKEKSEISLPVSDAMRMAVLMMPMLAFSLGARGWPWGASFHRLLSRIDVQLTEAEGKSNPRRTPVTPLFRGVMCHMGGEGQKALKLIGEAMDMAKSNQNDLVAIFAEQALGLACSVFDQVRSMDYFAGCYRNAHDLGWKMMERQLLSLCRRLNLPLQHQFPELLAESEKINFRRRTSGIALSHIMESWLVMSREPQTVSHYISQSPRIAARVLSSPLGMLFKRYPEERGVIKPFMQWVDDGNLFLQNLSDDPIGPKHLEAELVRNLPRFHDESIRLVPKEQTNSYQAAPVWPPNSMATPSEFGDLIEAGTTNTNTRLNETVVDSNRTQRVMSESERFQADTPYSVYVAIKHQDEFFGWMALSRVSLAQFSSKDSEFDLLLLARHIAFNFLCESRMVELAKSSGSVGPALHVVIPRDLELPEGITEERVGRIQYSDERGQGLFSLGADRVLLLQWSFETGQASGQLEIGGLFRHYTSLFVESVRDIPESISLEKFANKFSSDVGGILERTALGQRYERISVNAILIDLNSNEAQECMFGAEQFTFAGNSRVERELLLELNGVLRLDRLVYRERRRICTNNKFGWLLSHDMRFREVVPQFTENGFIEEFLNLKRGRGMTLSRLLSEKRMPEEFTALAVISDGTYSDKKNAA